MIELVRKEQREHDHEVAKAAVDAAKLNQQKSALSSPPQVILYGKFIILLIKSSNYNIII